MVKYGDWEAKSEVFVLSASLHIPEIMNLEALFASKIAS